MGEHDEKANYVNQLYSLYFLRIKSDFGLQNICVLLY